MLRADNAPMSEICVTTSRDARHLAPSLRSRGEVLEASRLHPVAGKDLFLTIEAPLVEPAQLLRLGEDEGFVYQPSTGPLFAGLGAARRLEARGEERFASLIAQAAALEPCFEILDFSGSAARPLFFGGLAFAPGSAQNGPWAPFGDASFVLPRWLYRRHKDRATLSLSLRAEEILGCELRDWLAELEKMAAALGAAPSPAAFSGIPLEVSVPDAEEVGRRIGAVGREIAASRLQKVVLALPFATTLQEELDPLQAFARLAASSAGSESTPFLFRRGRSTFLGATPELLVRRCGDALYSEALAGSCRSEESSLELFGSRKNGHEHEVVVRAIREALAPLCRSLEIAPRRLRRLRQMTHLFTPIEGRLQAKMHLLEVAARLHPTPAVGGWPKPDALKFLAGIEPEPRGWYAGPVGYFDSRGDGELRVALRSGIVQGRHATLYAGAGIVEGSVAAEELAEMVSKARPMLDALGGDQALRSVHASFTRTVEDSTNGPRKTSGRSRAA